MKITPIDSELSKGLSSIIASLISIVKKLSMTITKKKKLRKTRNQ